MVYGEDDTIVPPIVVTARDGNGNIRTTFTGNVTIAIGANPSNGRLKGKVTVKAVAGVATFDDLEVNKPGNNYTLVASAAGYNSATSAVFDVLDD